MTTDYLSTRNLLTTAILGFAFAALPAAQAQTIASILNAASYTTSVAPGTWVAIFGTGLSPSPVAADSAPFPVKLNGVSVTFAGIPAPLSFVGPGQVNALVPFDAAVIPSGTTVTIATVPVVVTTPAGASPAFSLRLQRGAPAIFTKNSAGTGEALVFDAAFNPVAKVGTDPIVLYATGLGPTDPPTSVASLGAAAEPLNRMVDSIAVTIAGNAAKVLYAGLAPGLHGIYQINVQPDPYSGNGLSVLTSGLFNARAVGLPIPLGTNAANVSGTLNGLYPPAGATTQLGISPLLNAASFDVAFDIAPGAKPFNITVFAGSSTARIDINPTAGTVGTIPGHSWTATYIVPSVASRSWNFSAAGFAPVDFIAGGFPLPGGIVPGSRVDPAAASAITVIPLPNAAGFGANGSFQASGALPASGHVTLAALGLPAAFGGFTNLAYVKGTYTVSFSLAVDSILVASKTGTYTLQ